MPRFYWDAGLIDRAAPESVKRTADVVTLCLSVVFWWLVRLGYFQACWRRSSVTPIPKGPPVSSDANYQPISFTSVLSKVFGGLVSVRLGKFIEGSDVLPTTQFAYRKGLGDVLCACPIHCKVYWRGGRRPGSRWLISMQPLLTPLSIPLERS